jgi:CubicO group peptidase (beta-lactamase class C family)
MNKVHRAVKATGYLVSAAGSALFGNKPPKPPKGVVFTVDDLETYVNNLVEMSRPPGLSLVVVKDGETVYQRSFGLADGLSYYQASACPLILV